MFISYENDEIRSCCLLLRPTSVNSSFTNDEIKEIRAFIADLKAAPRLIDAPILYTIDKELCVLNIEYNVFQIICKIISTYKNPSDDQIVRIKIMKIINTGVQINNINKHNLK